MKKYVFTLLFILFFSNISAPGLWRKENNKIIYSYQIKQLDLTLRSLPFTPQHLRLALEINVRYPEIVYKQALLETGWFKSKSFLIGNNFSGMKKPRIRKTTAIGKYLGHAKYKHWYDAVIDYKYYQDYYDSLGVDLSDYYFFLDKYGYSVDKDYVAVLKKL